MAALWAVALGVVYWETRELGRLRRLAAESASQRKEIESQIQAATKRGATAQKASIDLSSAINGLHTAKKTLSESPASVSAIADDQAIVANNPKLRQTYLNGSIADLYLKWGPLLKKLGLSPDENEKFMAIQLSLEETKVDLVASAKNEGLSLYDPNLADYDPTLDAQWKALWQKTDLDSRDLLGPNGYDTYHAYDQTLGTRILVNDMMASDIHDADAEPLTDFQADQLTQIMANASTRSKYGWVNYGTVNWQVAEPQAQAILTPAQYNAFQSLETQKAAQWKLTQMMAGAQK